MKKPKKKNKEEPGARCYFCGAPATSKEHVPPRGFFPKDKDLPAGTPSKRRGLLTVPACKKHNEDTSEDDAVVGFVVALNYRTNALARNQLTSKFKRAVAQDNAVGSRVVQQAIPARIDGMATTAVRVDTARVDATMQKIGRALYYHEYGEQWAGDLIGFSSDLVDPGTGVAPFAPLDPMLDNLLKNEPWRGENPDVFRYRIIRDSKSRCIVDMQFYEGFRYTVMQKKAGS